jgi:tetratricopeptide (TPR) repeat protein
MAFGLGFNKAKVLSAAEKYVQQGKLQNAIAEYEKILKHDPKDLTVLNTVGDLYARLGQVDEACSCFKNVGDAYAQQGFTVKAIAMYKKLTKLKTSLEGVLKLAELYTQQGLFNDARQQYLQVAEEFLRNGQLEQAVRIFQKTLEMDPENVAMKVRLAEVYVRLGKKNDAWQIFSSAAEQLRSRGQLAPAEDILQRMLTLDPNNAQALLLRGRNALEAGDAAAAVAYLQKVPDLDSQPEVLKMLFQGYIASDRLTEAGVLATKLLNNHNDVEGMSWFVAALMKNGLYQDALQIYYEYFERFMAADKGKAMENLHTIIGHVRDEPELLERLLELFQKAGETTHVSEVIELLAHASVKKGDLEKARGLYQQLTTMEPQNPIHAQNYQQVSAKLGDAPKTNLISSEEGAVIVDELEATAPSIDQEYAEELAAEIRGALTDAELFISYNMPAKAMVPLMEASAKAPQDLRLNQRLAALHTRAGRFAEAAVSCRALEEVYTEAGYAEEAGRYGELATRYEERAGTGVQSAAPASSKVLSGDPQAAPWPAVPAFEIQPHAGLAETHLAEPTSEEPVEEPAVQAAPAQEIDLSDEWEEDFSQEAKAPGFAGAAAESPAPEPMPAQDDLVPETVEEIRFYLQHAMRLQALAAMAKLEAISKDQKLITELRAEYESAFAPAPVAEPEPVEAPAQEIQAEEPFIEEVAEEAPAARQPAAASQSELNQLVADLESEIGDGFDIPAKPASKEPAHHAMQAVPVQAAEEEDTLGEFVADLDASLGDEFLSEAAPVSAKAQPARPLSIPRFEPMPSTAAAAAPAPALSPAPAIAAQVSVPQPVAPAPAAVTGQPEAVLGTDLSQMFSELKSELEEDQATRATEEDPETHYNLGVAFREMGLLDEAIGELQKVCQIVERGHAFSQVMQTYTWLAQCFLDKGVPQAAIRWYQQALKIPEINADTRIALHYELASAYEGAENRPAALNHFMEVYGTNIDYRDVAERIKALKS